MDKEFTHGQMVTIHEPAHKTHGRVGFIIECKFGQMWNTRTGEADRTWFYKTSADSDQYYWRKDQLKPYGGVNEIFNFSKEESDPYDVPYPIRSPVFSEVMNKRFLFGDAL